MGKKLSTNDIKQIRKGRLLQKTLAERLCRCLGGEYEHGFSLEDVKQVELLLDVQIKIICAENFNTVIYGGPEKDTKLYLYKTKNHYDAINRLAGLYGRNNYCNKCDTGYDHGHKCKKASICSLCKESQHDSKTKNKRYCSNCNRFCYNDICLSNHTVVCGEMYKCAGCNKLFRRENNHQCGFSTCGNCKGFVEVGKHQCYIVKKSAKGGVCSVLCQCNGLKKETNKGCHYNKCIEGSLQCKEPCTCNGLSKEKIRHCTYTEKYIFFDYEAMQNTGKHIPNLIIAHYFDGTKHKFLNNDEFCEWLISVKHKGYTAIAHNAKGYDSYFILKYCVENTMKPYTIYNGTKLMLLDLPQIKIKIIDSSNFVAGPLSDFPKTFCFSELKKGFFPHYFNTPKTQNYKGPLPYIQYYGHNCMKLKQRKEFLKWYASQLNKNKDFDFQHELHS